MEGSIEAFAQELMVRELRRRPGLFAPAPKFDLRLPRGVEVKPLHPEALAVVGGLADAASTYSFLKRGTGVETNAMYLGLNNSPAKTAAGVAGGTAAMMAARALLRKLGMSRVADLIAGAQGSHQIGLAAQNAQYDAAGAFPAGSEDIVRSKVQTAMTRRREQ
jgi:hypothetical protein